MALSTAFYGIFDRAAIAGAFTFRHAERSFADII